MSAPQKPDTPGKGLARALELDLDLEGGEAVARRGDRVASLASEEVDGERATVAPPFDVTEFARAASPTPPPRPPSPPRPPPPLPTAAQNSPSIVPMRGPTQTLTDEVELEDARRRSVNTTPPGNSSIPPRAAAALTPVAPQPAVPSSMPPSLEMPGDVPASRAVTAPPVQMSPSSEAETVKRGSGSTSRHPAEREPATRVARASGNLLMLADARLQSLVPTPAQPGNAWSTIDRSWSADDEEAPTDEADALVPPAAVDVPDARETARALDGLGDSSLPPASGRAGSEPPTSKRSPTLRPGAHTAPTPPAHKPMITRRATRVWTSETTSLIPAALSPSAPPSSAGGGGARGNEGDDGPAASDAAGSSVSPPGERSPHVGSSLEERVERALSFRPEAFDDDEAAREQARQRETPYPGGRQTRDLEAPKITPLAVPRLGLSDEDLTLIKSTAGRASSVPPTRKAETDPNQEMRERFSLGDYTGALVIAESILDDNADDLGSASAASVSEAREYAESCRSVLQQMYTARIGPARARPGGDGPARPAPLAFDRPPRGLRPLPRRRHLEPRDDSRRLRHAVPRHPANPLRAAPATHNQLPLSGRR